MLQLWLTVELNLVLYIITGLHLSLWWYGNFSNPHIEDLPSASPSEETQQFIFCQNMALVYVSCCSGHSNLNNCSRAMELRGEVPHPSAWPLTNVMTTVQRSSVSSFSQVRRKYYIPECHYLGHSLGLTCRIPERFLCGTIKALLRFLSSVMIWSLVLPLFSSRDLG